MTLTIDLPRETFDRLEHEAVRTGTPIDALVALAINEHLKSDPQAIFDTIAARVPPPGYVADLTREAIYAE